MLYYFQNTATKALVGSIVCACVEFGDALMQIEIFNVICYIFLRPQFVILQLFLYVKKTPAIIHPSGLPTVLRQYFGRSKAVVAVADDPRRNHKQTGVSVDADTGMIST